MEQVFTNKEHGSAMMKSLSQLWKDSRYCDAVLEVGSHELEFHKLVLVACSPFVLGSRAPESDTGKLILKLKGDEEDVEAAKACLQYMYEGVAQLNEDNVDNVVGIARVLHLEDLVMYCSSFQELVKNMKKLKKSLSDEGSPKTNRRYELLIKNEKCATKSALKDKADRITVDQSAFEMSTENAAPDSGDDYHSDFEQNIETSSIFDTEKDNGLNEVGGKIESFTVKQEPGSDISDAEGHNEDNDMSDNADSDDSYAPKIKKKKKSKVSKSKASMKIIKETEQFTVVKNENDNSFGETEQGEANTDIQTNKDDDKDYTAETLDDSIDLDGFIEHAEGKAKYKFLYKCPLCKSRFIRKDTFLVHLKSHADPQVTCPVCPKKFDTNEELESHKKSHLTHLCNQCGAAFITIKRLNEHLSYVHQTGKYKVFKCEIEGCGRVYPRKSMLEGHMNIHAGLKPHECARCGRGFANMHSRRRHQLDCRDKRTLPCDKCDEMFKTKASLHEHKVTIHQKNKTFACVCGKKYSWRSALVRHRSKHGKEHYPVDPLEQFDSHMKT